MTVAKRYNISMLVLGIETSCDDTATALYDTDQGLLTQQLYSQTALHNEFGGVVPELASRDHSRKIVPLIRKVLQTGHKQFRDLQGIAYTAGPGLIGALHAGAAVGHSLAYALNIPAIGVHHMEGHLLAPMLEEAQPTFPFVALLVSGGHTLLVVVKAVGDYQILGESLDDAAGEAFDKVAKLLGLQYPGGPALAKLAADGDAKQYFFPRPMTNRPGFDFSFSGLKTFALNTWNASNKSETVKAAIACAFEDAVVDTLLIKCRRALQHTGLITLVIAGGVSANKKLQRRLQYYMQQQGGKIFYPRQEFCTDNAAMIAYAGAQRLQVGQNDNFNIRVRPRWSLAELPLLAP